jgi:hypothetical protein
MVAGHWAEDAKVRLLGQECVEDLAQIMLALRCVLVHQREVTRREASLFIADVGWVELAGHRQTLLARPMGANESS